MKRDTKKILWGVLLGIAIEEFISSACGEASIIEKLKYMFGGQS